MFQPRRDLRALLHAHGYRSTPQRQVVIDVLIEHNRHMTPDEVYAHVQKATPGINRATIYRTLNFLCELGMVTASDIYGQRVFEIAGEAPHHHLVCQRCGKTSELDGALVEAFFDAVDKAQQFRALNRHLVLHGLCADCRAES